MTDPQLLGTQLPSSDSTIPAAAPAATTSTGDARQAVSDTNPTMATPASLAVVTELVQTGEYKAAAKSPTTAALIPRIMACASLRDRKLSQKDSVPISTSMPGRKMATSAIAAPITPCGVGVATAPRYAAKVNNGPGTA